ncbi:hypothetical protein Rhe02_34380 [Rhizocola hellebori]|uniref:Uncharacterized protein n=1 Tax=Rhizocola hellebori TaxID=1392758 RepID=A0A8J3Q7P4_9ACTN|nr:hypothetical protein Rhe02_34380 [Rhizocola hellebori]
MRDLDPFHLNVSEVQRDVLAKCHTHLPRDAVEYDLAFYTAIYTAAYTNAYTG